MTIRFKLLILFMLMFVASMCFGQEYEMQTLFSNSKRASGGYGAISNKFTEA